MNEIVLGILMVAAILIVCGLFFKLVIMNWLAHDRVSRSDEPISRTGVNPAPQSVH